MTDVDWLGCKTFRTTQISYRISTRGYFYEKVYTQTLVTRALRFKNKRQKSLVWKHQGHISS